MPRSTALEMSRGVAGSGMRLASDRARPGVRAIALVAERTVSDSLSLMPLVFSGYSSCLHCAGHALVAQHLLGSGSDVLSNLCSPPLGDLDGFCDGSLLLHGRPYRLCAAGVVGGELGVRRVLRRVVGKVLVELDLEVTLLEPIGAVSIRNKGQRLCPNFLRGHTLHARLRRQLWCAIAWVDRVFGAWARSGE